MRIGLFDWRDMAGGDQHRFEQVIAIKDVLASLTDEQRKAVLLYRHGLTQKEIAEEMGIRQQRVSELLREISVKHADSCVTVYEDKWNVNAYADNE